MRTRKDSGWQFSTTGLPFGVKRRTDPQQSIRGGADYLKMVEAKLPPRIKDPDRTWLALAGYDAQTVAAAFVVHALWGTLRSAVGVREAPHLISNWTAFSSAIALLVLIG